MLLPIHRLRVFAEVPDGTDGHNKRVVSFSVNTLRKKRLLRHRSDWIAYLPPRFLGPPLRQKLLVLKLGQNYLKIHVLIGYFLVLLLVEATNAVAWVKLAMLSYYGPPRQVRIFTILFWTLPCIERADELF